MASPEFAVDSRRDLFCDAAEEHYWLEAGSR